MRAWLLVLVACLATRMVAQEVHFPLNDGWTMGQLGKAPRYPAEVPGLVQTDLLRGGAIPDPYLDQNVDSVQWIEEADWVYERTLHVDEALLRHRHVDLVFQGLDMFAEVYLNDSLVGRADNMFRRWEFPVEKLIHRGEMRLKIIFRSPIRAGRERRSAYGLQLPADNDAGPDKVSPYLRKAAYQFGWDFVPRLVTSGIWQPVELRCWDRTRLVGTRSRATALPDGAAEVDVRVAVWSDRPTSVLVRSSIRDGVELEGRVKLHAGLDTIHIQLPLLQADPWWPLGSGRQTLYDLRVEAWNGCRQLFAVERPIGIRAIELDQRMDSLGKAFTFVVNGRPVFIKGCNLVPPDLFLPRAGDSAWVALVGHMRRAHMNMVRVWGGGVYPPDAFFTACDTAGILVWEDLMFANMTPGDNAFTANVEAEVRDQIGRWGDHPCLALINGNNELDVAWANWGWQTTYGLHGADSARVRQDHVGLFHERLPVWVQALSDVPYVPTSPLSNWGSQAGLRNGDLHYWGVWHGDSAFSSFAGNVGRFVSEYGFQSWPDSALLARYIRASDLHIGSPALQERQRSYKGDAPILEAIRREMGREPKGLADLCTLSRDVQAMAYRTAAEAHLAAAPRCMGTLFWQLNTPWTGPSWSVLDHTGNWKPALRAIAEVYGR